MSQSKNSEIGRLLGSFTSVGGAAVVVILAEHHFHPGDEDAYPGWGDVAYVAVEGRCPGLGCNDPLQTFTHGASSCRCCGSNPPLEMALALAEKEGCAWGQRHASTCRAMPRS